MAAHALRGPHRPPNPMHAGPSPRVLVIDDDREILHGLQTRLQFAGFDVQTALDGEGGLAAAESWRPDAVLLDIRMPKMDGLTVLRELRRRGATRETPVIMLSASLRDRRTALDEGARFFVQKPYEPRAVLAALQAALGERARSSAPGAE